MAASVSVDERYRRGRFKEYLDVVLPRERLDQMISRGERRLIVDLDHLNQFDSNFTRALLAKAAEYIPILREALNDFVYSATSTSAKITSSTLTSTSNTSEEFNSWSLGFTGSFGSNHVNPRTLRSTHIWSLICIEGMVTKCSMIHPKLLKSVHYCEKTQEIITRTYPDESTTFGALSSGQQQQQNSTFTSYPTKDPSGNPLVTEYGLCNYKDRQSAILQEMPEFAPAGQLPRSVYLILDDDLVDQIKPGDRVQIVGVYIALPHYRESKFSSGTSGANAAPMSASTFRTLLVVNNIKQVLRDTTTPTFTASDMRNIRNVSKNEGVVEQMSLSLAPSIFGHDAIKRAMLLQLLGGQEKTTSGGMHLRGDIHLLLVGDPSTAKSQLLRYMIHVAPLAVSTNARGASGVGLTAAVVMDPETHERALEAGATVLADRGIVCIDEFDKMNIDDRAALHEVMEQQTVTIQKAGVHASLNARCSVFAAANPIYGTYDRSRGISQNIGFPPSLLSRFDALFIVLDPADPTRDRIIAEHVLRMHRDGFHAPLGDSIGNTSLFQDGISGIGTVPLIGNNGNNGNTNLSSENNDPNEETPIYVQQQPQQQKENQNQNQQLQRFSVAFIRKYILYAKHRIFPKMTNEAGNILQERFLEFRQRSNRQNQRQQQATLPITARLLESFVRLSEAHARCRLSQIVTPEDAEAAVALSRFALFGEGTGIPEPKSSVPQQINNNPLLNKRRKGITNKEMSKDEEEIREMITNLFQESVSISVETISWKLENRYQLPKITEVLKNMEKEGRLVFDDGFASRPI